MSRDIKKQGDDDEKPTDSIFPERVERESLVWLSIQGYGLNDSETASFERKEKKLLLKTTR